ncbi:helix-turn-helix domain-containing protein [Bauldia sp.]|uniref:helix-turn-helix domain-containing protein n=1 Tax=Bauldia sp. TaxID=2575872 RepID=UPI003BAA498D
MARAPIGHRIRKRRRELSLSQVALAARVGISPSYLNLIEHNKRSIGGAILNRIATALDLNASALAGTEEARLIAELGEVVADSTLAELEIDGSDVSDVVGTSPKAARAILALFRAYTEARLRSDLIGERLGEESFLAEASQEILALITTIRSYSEILKDYGDLSDAERSKFVDTLVGESERLTGQAGDLFDFLSGRGARRPQPSPREAIEDFIFDHANYFPALEDAAEAVGRALGSGGDPSAERLTRYLDEQHGLDVERSADDEREHLHLEEGRFQLPKTLGRASVRFRLARLIGELEHGDIIDDLAQDAAAAAPASAATLRRALANYFAAALIMPYELFIETANSTRHDIRLLVARFDSSFEQVCHRLATLRRPGTEGVPIHFLRSDIAGNISKRFSASGLRLPRYGSACPRWIIHRAFATPGRIISQVAALPDGEAYLFIASTCMPSDVDMDSHHAVMIGANIADARKFVYADSYDLDDLGHATPVGVTCRQCPRDDCTYRAFEKLAMPGLEAAAQ